MTRHLAPMQAYTREEFLRHYGDDGGGGDGGGDGGDNSDGDQTQEWRSWVLELWDVSGGNVLMLPVLLCHGDSMFALFFMLVVVCVLHRFAEAMGRVEATVVMSLCNECANLFVCLARTWNASRLGSQVPSST